jgi:hypothetical protein
MAVYGHFLPVTITYLLSEGTIIMAREITETDWKLFRQLQLIALERLSERIVSDVRIISSDTGNTFHQRYLGIFDLIQSQNENMSRAFDNPRRSTALMQLAAIRSQGLITDDEFNRFSDETCALIEILIGSDRA